MNLQSNAIKFTKPGGKVKIKIMLIRSEQSQIKHRNPKSLFSRSFASDSSSSGKHSTNSDTKKFDKEYGLENLLQPLPNDDKLVISVQDTGIGIKNKDRIRLFKLFGKL